MWLLIRIFPNHYTTHIHIHTNQTNPKLPPHLQTRPPPPPLSPSSSFSPTATAAQGAAAPTFLTTPSSSSSLLHPPHYLSLSSAFVTPLRSLLRFSGEPAADGGRIKGKFRPLLVFCELCSFFLMGFSFFLLLFVIFVHLWQWTFFRRFRPTRASFSRAILESSHGEFSFSISYRCSFIAARLSGISNLGFGTLI